MFVKIVLFCAVSLAGYYLSYTLFENERFFSHLSTVEREMSFRTEAGFYYSFYKVIVGAPSFLEGWNSLVKDTGTEYPSEINTLQRFNVYPEVILGAAFRTFRTIISYSNVTQQYRQCYQINRGERLSPVESCAGPGELSIFYINAIFGLAGIHVGVLLLFGWHMSGSILGGILTVSCYFFNYFQCTRVHGIPPLRESFSMPFLTLQILLVSGMLRDGATLSKRVFLVLTTVCLTVPWQFTQFVLLTQTLSLFGSYLLSYSTKERITPIIDSVFVGFIIATFFQFLNTMLISSLYISAFLAFKCVILMDSHITMQNKIVQFFRGGIVFVIIAAVYKITSAFVFNLSDDAHIFNIFKSKFTDFKDFHTLLYVCSDTFSFIGFNYFKECSKTLLFPTAVAVLLRLGYVFYKDFLKETPKEEISVTQEPGKRTEKQSEKKEKQTDKKEKIRKKNKKSSFPGDTLDDDDNEIREVRVSDYYHLPYHVFQCGCYFAMAVMLMRLKLFFSPFMAILCSLVASDVVLPLSSWRRHVVVFTLVGAMSVGGYRNMIGPITSSREYTNLDQEELLDWVMKSTKPDAVFAGPMAVTANLRLTTERNIVNHPHYEDSGLRARTKLVYQVFSRKHPVEVHRSLQSLQAEYVLLDKNWCIPKRPTAGCALPEIWDLEDADNAARPTFCNSVENFPELFAVVFSNKKYRVLRILEEED